MTKLLLTETLANVETGFAVKCRRMVVRTWYAATAASTATASAPTPRLQYDAGMGELRPLPPISAQQQIDAYTRSLPAMLNRRF